MKDEMMPKVKMASGKVKHYAYTEKGKDAAKKAKAAARKVKRTRKA
jgi:hypothetical protein